MPPRPNKKARFTNVNKCLLCGKFIGRGEHLYVQETANCSVCEIGVLIVGLEKPLDATYVALQGKPSVTNSLTPNIIQETATNNDVFIVELSETIALESQVNIERLEGSVGENSAPFPLMSLIQHCVAQTCRRISESIMHFTTFCFNCLRESTLLYHLTFTTCPTDFTPVRRKLSNFSGKREGLK